MAMFATFGEASFKTLSKTAGWRDSLSTGQWSRQGEEPVPDFVYDVPTTTLAIWFSLVAVAAMFVGVLVLKPIFRLLIGTGPDFNASVGYATSGFSLFYGLLLGLLTVAAFQNSDRVREATMAEGTALGSIYSQVDTYPEPIRGEVQEMMRDYVLFTIHRDWPAHNQGLALNGGHDRADAILRKLATFNPESEAQSVVHGGVMASFESFSDARQRRLAGVNTKIPDVLWYAVLVGAVINILLVALLRMRLLPHLFLGAINAFFLGVILFVIVTLDRPLRGESAVQPEPLRTLWERSMVWDEPNHLG